MGIDDHRRKAFAASGRPVAAFDFDGTLTVRDSFWAFLTWRFDTARLVLGLLRLTPAALRYGFDRDRGRIKASLVAEFLEGWSAEQLAAEGERFAEAAFPALLRPDALEAWRSWGECDAVRVIVTASPELLVQAFAQRLDADLLLGTRLELDSKNRLTGRLSGPNCRAHEKVVRLREVFGENLRLAAAYGDTTGDTEMLAIADEAGYRVFKAKP